MSSFAIVFCGAVLVMILSVRLSSASEDQVIGGSLAIVGGVGAYVAWRIHRKKEADATALTFQEANERSRRDYERGLVERYGAGNAGRILAKELWQGATSDMVIEMLGEPADKSRRVFKTKTTETWKYDPMAKNRFRLKVTLENGICVGWDTVGQSPA